MAAIHDEYNDFLESTPGAKGRSRKATTAQAEWLTSRGIPAEKHASFKSAARVQKTRIAQGKVKHTSQIQQELEHAHDTLSRELRATPNPVKVEFPTGKENTRTGRWTERFVPSEHVPTFLNSLGGNTAAVTFIDHSGEARSYRLKGDSSRRRAGVLDTFQGVHAGGGMVIDASVKQDTRGFGKVPYPVTPNVGDVLDLATRANRVKTTREAIDAVDIPSIEMPPDLKYSVKAVEHMRDIHQENLATVERHGQLQGNEPVVVPTSQVRAFPKFLRSVHDQMLRSDPHYAHQFGVATDAMADRMKAEAAHQEAISSYEKLQARISATGEESTDFSKVARIGGITPEALGMPYYKVESGGAPSTPENAIDYVYTKADTPRMRQSRTVMHLANATAQAGGGDTAKAAESARRAEAAAGVRWDEPAKDEGVNLLNFQPSPEHADEVRQGALQARIAGQMRSHPLYAGAIEQGLARTAKAQGAAGVGWNSSPERVAGAMHDIHTEALGESPTIGYEPKDYSGGAPRTDPFPPWYSHEAADLPLTRKGRQAEAGGDTITDTRNEVRASLAGFISTRGTRASRR